jgi:hypothetical protein
MTFEKDCTEKDHNKKINILTNEKALLERQFNEFKLRMAQK